jgi:ATP-dependent Clp protease ATP-binding subunit ClpC
MENVQELYDQAFQHWEADETEQAVEKINRALELSPNDISLHALAIYIKRRDTERASYLPHVEFIIDHDIHYADTLNKSGDQHFFLKFLSIGYFFLTLKAEQFEKGTDPLAEDIGIPSVELAARECKYFRKALAAGYKPGDINRYVIALMKAGLYEEVIELGQYLVKAKSAQELGLPGLDIEERNPLMEENWYTDVHKAYFRTGRNHEELIWCREYHKQYPNNPYFYFITGEVFTRLNNPAETVRQWMIGTQGNGDPERFTEHIGAFLDMVSDNDYFTKFMLRRRLYTLKDKVPAKSKALYEKINTEIFSSIGDPDKKVIEESYIENALKMKLPPVEEKDYFCLGEIWIPKKFGPHPLIPPDPYITSAEKDSDNAVEAIVPKTNTMHPETIERYGIDLTAQVRSGKYPPVVGRDREIDALIRILLRMEKNNPVLLGDAGVGKTAIILGMAQKLNAEHVPAYLQGKRIIELSMSSLVGGTMWRGDFETRITKIIDELRENKDIILFVDELHTIMGAGAANLGDLDVANIAKPALAKGEIRLVGATTNHEYGQYIEKDQAMARRFTPVRVAEMDREATLHVLRHRVNFWRDHHQVTVPEKALLYAVDLTEQQLRHRRFPDKAIDLLDESCAYLRTRQKSANSEILTLSTDDVNHVFKEWTGTIFAQEEDIQQEKKIVDIHERDQLLSSLQKEIVAQPKVIEQLAFLALQIRHSIKDPLLPSVLLFHGQPGTGKTTSANALAHTLWPTEEDRVMVINMAEYSDAFSYHRLIGGPPGYAGFDEEGILTARIKRKPFSIVVLKNIREAHVQVIHFFSSLFRTGVFSDKRGQDILAGDIVFILHFDIKPGVGSMGFLTGQTTDGSDERRVEENLKKHGVPPTLLKTYVQMFEFQALTRHDMEKILHIHIQKLQNIYLQKGITLKFKEKILAQLTEYFYQMPGEKRNMEMLIDQFLIPKLRNKMLTSKSKTIKQITISE